MFDLRAETFSMLQEMNADWSCIISDPPIEFLTAGDDARKANINHAPMTPHTRYLVHHHRWCEIRNFLSKCIAWCSKEKKLIGFWSNFGSNFNTLTLQIRISLWLVTKATKQEKKLKPARACRVDWTRLEQTSSKFVTFRVHQRNLRPRSRFRQSTIGSQTWNFIDFGRQRNWFVAKPLVFFMSHDQRPPLNINTMTKHERISRDKFDNKQKQQPKMTFRSHVNEEIWNWVWVSVNGTLDQLSSWADLGNLYSFFVTKASWVDSKVFVALNLWLVIKHSSTVQGTFSAKIELTSTHKQSSKVTSLFQVTQFSDNFLSNLRAFLRPPKGIFLQNSIHTSDQQMKRVSAIDGDGSSSRTKLKKHKKFRAQTFATLTRENDVEP